MLHYSTYQIISNDDIKKLNDLSINVELYQKNDRKYSSYQFTNEDKEIFLGKILNWIEDVLEIKLNKSDYKYYDSFLIKYDVGSYFHKHKDDTYMKFRGSTRKYVVGFHLSNEYKGGEYCIYDSNNNIELIGNDIGYTYVFDSETYHEVKPIVEGVRKSVIIHIEKENIVTSKKEII
jgi:Rps23 Pro-64 3,4-dihydroxylase Tpa1-like proline 4-hydroxylase